MANEMRNPQPGGLALLSETKDLKVADGNPDVRGWDVLASDGTDVGEVKDLLVDPGAMKVRYLVVELDKKVAGTADRRVLVPVGAARLDDDDDKVLLQGMALQSITGLPPYMPAQFSRSYEDTLRERWGFRKAAAQPAGRDYYE